MKELTSQNFQSSLDITFKKDKLALVAFCGTWCRPCKAMIPVLQQVEEEFSPDIDFYKVTVDKSQDIAQRYGVETVPMIFVFDDGSIVHTCGVCSKEELSNNLECILAGDF